ncbi:hypothetical protein CIK05_05870 [Bdellovibrio sp. qaytius]|nr:hypothetical protein CIK05_05870 [Bdellovibrio sp. qaytius]
MNSLLGSLLTTTQSSVLLGFSLAICIVSCVLCFSFYVKFKHQSLLNLGLAIIAFQFMMLMYDQMPTQFLVFKDNPLLKRLAHFSGGLIVYCFYRLFTSSFQPFPSFKFITERFYKAVIVTAMSVRLAGIIYPHVILFRLASLSNIVFYITTLILCIRFKSARRSMLMLRLGCGIGVMGLSVYPLIRTGIISSDFLNEFVNYILIVTITAFSVLSLIGALELGREYLDRAEKSSLRNMARAFIQLRDLVNTPFQTIDLSVQLLRQRHPDENMALQKIENSLQTLRRVDAALAKYESSVDWNQTESFIELDSDLKN